MASVSMGNLLWNAFPSVPEHDFREAIVNNFRAAREHPLLFKATRRLAMNPLALVVIVALVLLLVILALSAIRVVQQYERGVIFVLGRLIGAKGPGLFLVPPLISRMSKVDLRIVTLTVPPQEVITRDNVTIRVTAVVYFYVTDPIA